MMDLKCSSYVANVAAAIVRDLSVFLSWAVMRTTGTTATKPLTGTCPFAGIMIPVDRMQSSLTGVGSPTSQSSSSI